MFNALINRKSTPSEWHKIPWNDPDFSRRMLAEHLTQDHDLASRRLVTVDAHVNWIHNKVLCGKPSRILDLGCGPGFYVSRFTALGHTCTGIDFSPASIDHARANHPDGDYILGDLRTLEFGTDYDFVSLIYGELNAFSPDEAAHILEKAHAALKPGGKLLLEVHTYAFIHRIGNEPASWFTAPSGLFSDGPYVCLSESSFELDHAVSRYFVFLDDSGVMQEYTSMHQGYTDDEYRHLLRAFNRVTFYPALSGSGEPADLFVIVAEK